MTSGNGPREAIVPRPVPCRMSVPDFVLALRSHVGHDLLSLVGVTAVVRNNRGEILLGLRSDVGEWALPSGIVEPSEEPAHAVVREVEEETAVLVEVTDLASVSTTEVVACPNGDRSVYLDLTFLARAVGGTARVNDDESTEVGWFALDALPPLRKSSQCRLGHALAFTGRTWFVT